MERELSLPAARAIRWRLKLGEWDRISISVSGSLSLLHSLPLPFSIPSVKPSSSISALVPSWQPSVRPRLSSPGFLRVLGHGTGWGAPNICLRRTFLRPINLNLPWFFIHKSQGHAFLLVTQERGGVGGGCLRHPPPGPIGVHPSSASMKEPQPSHKKKNGSRIQTWSLIKQWINVNTWRHATKRITWSVEAGGSCPVLKGGAKKVSPTMASKGCLWGGSLHLAAYF